MGSGPANATLSGEGFRFYRWQETGSDEYFDLLSVTSIRKLCGESYGLVAWQLGNILDTVLGTVKRPKMGKRGAPLKNGVEYRVDEYPSEFARRYAEADGSMEKLTDLRKWARDAADQPRNIAARRGTIVHAAIEKNVAWDRIERDWVEAEFRNLSSRDRESAKNGVTDDDVEFVRHSVMQYWDMRANVPFVIIAREPQVFNLTLGYGGSADTIIWFLPPGVDPRSVPKAHLITLKDVERIGGSLAVGDWKTAKGVYTDHVVQVHAYGAGEFVGEDGVKNHRLTELLQATTKGLIVHIRPEGWGVYTFPFTEEAFNAFVGSCTFARFLAKYVRPYPLFTDTQKGGALPEEDE